MSVFVIAEAGVCHNGSFEQALKLVDAAKSTVADAVKFQLFDSRKLWEDSRIAHLELTRAQILDLRAYALSTGLEFLCTPFGVEEALFLKPLVKRMKIASGCIGRFDLLEAVSDMPVLLSTGMSTPLEIGLALIILGNNVTLLHCTSSYPCRMEDVNLLAMNSLKRDYSLPVGYSDHTQGITVAIAAAALGATVIEKHLTLDRTTEGPDHKASIEPEEFRVMVSAIRTVETALGDGVKRVMDCELELRKAWRDKR